ncbi:MATE family efflux transporter [Miniimonas sp. S16]|uniref:MATE family efflux transporter n=1 Tax=Miniimonas sp. S16 TaxID=2171623 RepID=UPI000D529641|nr:MATE family efflux transporter [Miniimonas sp. S16]
MTTTNLTSGSPLRLITLFALPLLAGLVLQQLYSFADAVVVGRTLGMDALAAVGASGSIMFLLLGFTMGMTNGFSIPVAKAFGAGDAAGVRRAVATGAALSAGAAVLLTLVGVPFSRQLLVWMATPASLLTDATTFLTVIFVGCASMIAFNFLSGIIRALGDSRTPLLFLTMSSLLNIALVVVLIRFVGMGVGGAALATVTAQLVTVFACLALIARRLPALRPQRADWRLRRGQVVESLHLGLPMGFNMSIIAIGALVLQYAINRLGSEAVAAFTAGSRVDQLAMTAFQAFGMATATYVAQNRGAAQWSRIRQGVRSTLWLVTGISIAVGLACMLWGQEMVRAFAGADAHADAIVHDAHTLLLVNGGLYWMLALLFVLRSALQGMGRSGVPTLSGVMELVLRSAAALLLVVPLGFLGACLAAPLAWLGALVPLAIAWRLQVRDLVTRTDGELVSADGALAPVDAERDAERDAAIPALAALAVEETGEPVVAAARA